MTKLFYAGTPAGNKALLMLEELGIKYTKQDVNVFKGIQRTEEYKNIIPTGKIPAVINEDNKLLFESNAIIISLAYKYGKFVSHENGEEILSWFFWEASELSPKFYQHYRTKMQNPESTEIIEKIEQNLKVLFDTLNNQLKDKDYITGEFSIVDIATYPWLKNYIEKNVIVGLIDGLDNVKAWLSRMDNREAVKNTNKISSEFSWETETSIEEIQNFVKKN